MRELAWIALLVGCRGGSDAAPARFASLVVDPRAAHLHVFWKAAAGEPLKDLAHLRDDVARTGHQLRFAMNAGMYEAGNQPKGLLVVDRRVVHALDTGSGDGNFYLQPNGVLFLTGDGAAHVVPTARYAGSDDVTDATQSGPMLIVDGAINPRLSPASSHRNIRNGVGVRPDGDVVLAMSRDPISLHDFAAYFASQGCRDALYLDGFVSRMYAPELGVSQLDGDFAAMIGIIDDP